MKAYDEYDDISETKELATKKQENFTITENGEILLRTGKKITLRKKTGAHHMVENRLLAMCVPRGSQQDEMGINIGDMVAMGDIRAVVSIEAIDGRQKKVPKNLAEVFELMAEFSYDDEVDEWSDFKLAVSPNKDKVEEMAKNLQGKAGSETESALPIGAGLE